MSLPIAITGTGAVSPAGWGVAALMQALRSGERITPSILERLSGETAIHTPVLRVPSEGATTPKFARLRRTSPISKFAAAAAAEALGDARLAEIAAGNLRVGVIFTLTNGCVNYSNRFFGEALADPALASPILFPGTIPWSVTARDFSPGWILRSNGSSAVMWTAAWSFPRRRSTG